MGGRACPIYRSDNKFWCKRPTYQVTKTITNLSNWNILNFQKINQIVGVWSFTFWMPTSHTIICQYKIFFKKCWSSIVACNTTHLSSFLMLKCINSRYQPFPAMQHLAISLRCILRQDFKEATCKCSLDNCPHSPRSHFYSPLLVASFKVFQKVKAFILFIFLVCYFTCIPHFPSVH